MTTEEQDKISCKRVYDIGYEVVKCKIKDIDNSNKYQMYKQFEESLGMNKDTCNSLLEYFKNGFERYNKDELFELLRNSNEFSICIVLIVFVIIGRYCGNY